MRHSRLVFVGLFALILSLASPVRAQVVQSGTIEVMVLDSSGGALPGVSVTATAADTTTRRSAVSDSTGKAVVLGLDPSAAYEVVVSLQGFKQAKFDKVLVRSGQTTTINATLAIVGMT